LFIGAVLACWSCCSHGSLPRMWVQMLWEVFRLAVTGLHRYEMKGNDQTNQRWFFDIYVVFKNMCWLKESWSILSQKPRPLQDQLCFESGILLVIVFATGSRLFFLIWSTSWISPQLSCCNAGPKEVSVVSAPQSPIDHLVHPRVIFQKASVNFGAPATGRPMHRVWGILFEGRVLHRDAETQWLSELS